MVQSGWWHVTFLTAPVHAIVLRVDGHLKGEVFLVREHDALNFSVAYLLVQMPCPRLALLFDFVIHRWNDEPLESLHVFLLQVTLNRRS